MTARRRDPGTRMKYAVLALFLAGGGLGMLAATQTWYTFLLAAAADHPEPIVVQGSNASPALTALALTGIALAGALALAGRVTRAVLGVLGVILGVCVVWSTLGVMAAPKAAGVGAITKATGVAGNVPVEHLIVSVGTSIWPGVAIAAGVLLAAAGAAAIVTGRSWPGSSHRYQAVRFEAADAHRAAEHGAAAEPPSARDAAIDDWDHLTHGDDPTR